MQMDVEKDENRLSLCVSKGRIRVTKCLELVAVDLHARSWQLFLSYSSLNPRALNIHHSSFDLLQ